MKLLISVFVCFCLTLSTEVFACPSTPTIDGPDQVDNSVSDPYDGVGEYTIVLDPVFAQGHQGYVSTYWEAEPDVTPPTQTGDNASIFFDIEGPPSSWRFVTITATLTFQDGYQYVCTKEVFTSVTY